MCADGCAAQCQGVGLHLVGNRSTIIEHIAGVVRRHPGAAYIQIVCAFLVGEAKAACFYRFFYIGRIYCKLSIHISKRVLRIRIFPACFISIGQLDLHQALEDLLNGISRSRDLYFTCMRARSAYCERISFDSHIICMILKP